MCSSRYGSSSMKTLMAFSSCGLSRSLKRTQPRPSSALTFAAMSLRVDIVIRCCTPTTANLRVRLLLLGFFFASGLDICGSPWLHFFKYGLDFLDLLGTPQPHRQTTRLNPASLGNASVF